MTATFVFKEDARLTNLSHLTLDKLMGLNRTLREDVEEAEEALRAVLAKYKNKALRQATAHMSLYEKTHYLDQVAAHYLEAQEEIATAERCLGEVTDLQAAAIDELHFRREMGDWS